MFNRNIAMNIDAQHFGTPSTAPLRLVPDVARTPMSCGRTASAACEEGKAKRRGSHRSSSLEPVFVGIRLQEGLSLRELGHAAWGLVVKDVLL